MFSIYFVTKCQFYDTGLLCSIYAKSVTIKLIFGTVTISDLDPDSDPNNNYGLDPARTFASLQTPYRQHYQLTL
jgi:hypothetical protein